MHRLIGLVPLDAVLQRPPGRSVCAGRLEVGIPGAHRALSEAARGGRQRELVADAERDAAPVHSKT